MWKGISLIKYGRASYVLPINTKDKKMERNQNGYPTPATASTTSGCDQDREATLNDRPLAYAYVPIQRWRMLYPVDEALGKGALFEELYKPMEVYGHE